MQINGSKELSAQFQQCIKELTVLGSKGKEQAQALRLLAQQLSQVKNPGTQQVARLRDTIRQAVELEKQVLDLAGRIEDVVRRQEAIVQKSGSKKGTELLKTIRSTLAIFETMKTEVKKNRQDGERILAKLSPPTVKPNFLWRVLVALARGLASLSQLCAQSRPSVDEPAAPKAEAAAKKRESHPAKTEYRGLQPATETVLDHTIAALSKQHQQVLNDYFASDEHARADYEGIRDETERLAALTELAEMLAPAASSLDDTILRHLEPEDQMAITEHLAAHPIERQKLESIQSEDERVMQLLALAEDLDIDDPDLQQAFAADAEDAPLRAAREKELAVGAAHFTSLMEDFTPDLCAKDGDCMYHGFAKLLGWDVQEVRNKLKEFMKKNEAILLKVPQERYGFEAPGSDRDRLKAFRAETEKVGKLAGDQDQREGWAGLWHAKWLAVALGIQVHVYYSHLKDPIILNPDGKQTLYMVNNGVNHWDRLIPKRKGG